MLPESFFFVLCPVEAGHDLRLFPVGVGEIGLAPALDLKQGRLRDIDVPLPDQGRRQPVEHGEDQRADLEAVHVRVGADDDPLPPKGVDVKGIDVLGALVLHLHAAAQHPQQIGDDVAFEYLVIIGLQAVEDLAPHGHDTLKLRVPALLAGAQSGVALHDIQLPPLHISGAAVHEFLDAVGDVDAAGELLFCALPR